MPWNKSNIRCSGRQPVACSALAALACIALANCGAGPGAVHPDLVVEHPAVSDHRPAAAASFTFSATVRNAGDGSAAATTLRVYRSDDATITASNERVGAAKVPQLAASASGALSVKVMAPSSPGTSYYGACVDPVAVESDTANNCSATVRVVVQMQSLEPASPQPDLLVESPAVSAAGPVAGARFSFSATVRNAGDGDAAAATLRVYRSDDETITPSDEQVGAAAVPALAASTSSPASVELRAPSSSGTYYYGACVHAVAEESDTANNCSAPVQVAVQAAQVPVSGPRPDLVVNRLRVSAGKPAIGGLFELDTEVVNIGSATAGPTALRFYRSTDATVTRSDTEFATVWLWPLPGRDLGLGLPLVTVRALVTAPSSKAVLYFGACVDTVAGESATTNNCSAALKVEVSQHIPDLFATTLKVPTVQPTGASLSLGMHVCNQGSPSKATTLRFILLPDSTSAPSAGTRVGAVAVPELGVTQDSEACSFQAVEFKSPATAGRYYYVMCVDAVTGESNTANNCSSNIPIDFADTEGD
ncbi:MAG: hypothetical protein OXP69_18700 [Spirochaetaceae bacterium]|nr:hypothetical protein [Spirochaetaceae bacterium]